MVVDAEGNLWVAVRDETRPGVRVYTPEGEELAYVETPDKPTNVRIWTRQSEQDTLHYSRTLPLQYPDDERGGVSPTTEIAL